jgi:hypothetical protein
MPLLFKDYTDLVVQAFQQMRTSDTISPLLTNPSTGNLRQACLNVYNERLQHGKEELHTLEAFFGVPANGVSFLTHIDRCPLDNFRPLRNFMLGEIKNPSSVTVELLAWLIDFTPRPLGRAQVEFEKRGTGFKEQVSAGSGSNVTETVVNFPNDNNMKVADNGNDQTDQAEKEYQEPVQEIKPSAILNNEKKSTQKRKWLIAGMIVLSLLLSGGLYWSGFIRNEQCMYWKDDHYERIDCDAEVNDKVAFNEDRYKNFKKITDLSTITEKSIGVVHYYGNKNREFYTRGGKHPVENTRYVKVMTRYIWEKEFKAKDSTTKDTTVAEPKKHAAN